MCIIAGTSPDGCVSVRAGRAVSLLAEHSRVFTESLVRAADHPQQGQRQTALKGEWIDRAPGGAGAGVSEVGGGGP